MMSKKAKIVSIDIELEDFEPIHLKLAEAKELYEQLHDLFGKEKQVQYVPWYQQPYYHWYGQTTTDAPLTKDTTTITCSSSSVTSDNTGMAVSYNMSEGLNGDVG